MPKPEHCPFCGRKDCLISWGCYKVNTKRLSGEQLPTDGKLYIRRFYCKNTGRTVSLLPDFLLPRKQYTSRFIEAVLGSHLGKRHKLCATARGFSLYYQTVQKWLRGLSSKREVKTICFARHGPFSNPADVPDDEYARRFWNMLTGAFAGAPGGVLTAAGGLLWSKYECPLF